MRKAIAFLALVLICTTLAASETVQTIRAPIWVYLETVPGSRSPEEAKKAKPPIQELDDLARFIMGGMVYGWKFSYTPSDKTRKVEESFSMEPLGIIARNDPHFSLTELVPDYPRLYCWAQFNVDETLARWTSYWGSVLFKSARGQGRGERSQEAAGIRTAYENAVKQAVRDHERKLEKNKPKEIQGEVLLRDSPRLFVDEGWFVADVRLTVNIREIIPYSTF
jgi:hypothetical protein